MLSNSLQEILEQNPEARRVYEENPAFKSAIDDLVACFDTARRELSDEDYAEFLKWGVAQWQEWL